MSEIIHNNEGITEGVRTFNVNKRHPSDGYDLRYAMVLKNYEKNLLKVFMTDSGKTESDVYIVYKCRTNSNTECIDNNMVPYLIAEDIIALGDHNAETDFCLPVFAIQDSVWMDTFPNFRKWLFSSCRYPYIYEGKLAPTMKTQGSFRSISNVDIYELYTGLFIGTLNEYYKTGNEKYAKHCWRIRWTLNQILSDITHYSNMHMLMEKKEKIHSVIKNDFNEYKKLVDQLNESDYYWIMYNLIVEAPDCINTRMINLDRLICGLLTQLHFVVDGNELGCKYEFIQDNLLKLILNDVMSKHKLNKSDLYKIYNINDLVNFLHMHVGPDVESSLRFYAFLWIIIIAIGNREYSMNNFIEIIKTLREQLCAIRGITTLCLLINVESIKYLNDNIIAESILNIIEGSPTYNFGTETPSMLALINRNKERKNNINKKETISEEECSKIWDEFLKSVECKDAKELHSGGKYKNFKELVNKYAKGGTEKDLSILQYIVKMSIEAKPQVLGMKKINSLIMSIAPINSAVSEYYSPNSSKLKKKPISQLAPLPKESQRSEPEYENMIDYIKYDRACELMEIVTNNIKDKVLNIEQQKLECPICFKNTPLEHLHDMKHKVCIKCKEDMSECAFCKKRIYFPPKYMYDSEY